MAEEKVSSEDDEYVEPSKEEMLKLFDGIPVPSGYKNYAELKFVLPVSLRKFYYLWYADDGPQLTDKYMPEKHANNRAVKMSKFYSPPQPRFRQILQWKCQKQRDAKWNIYASFFFQNMPQDNTKVLCANEKTSFVMFERNKNY